MDQESSNDQKISLVPPYDNSGNDIVWNTALEELMCQEAEKCAGLAWLHTRSEIYYSKCHDRLQIPQIILSTIVGAASVGAGTLLPYGIVSVFLGGISIFVSILGLLNTHYKFTRRTEGHKLGSIQYSQIHRMIHIEMSLPRHQRMEPKQILRYIKYDLKRLMETLPRVPDRILCTYIKDVIPKSENVSHPDITIGIKRMYRIPVVHGDTLEDVNTYHIKNKKNEVYQERDVLLENDHIVIEKI